MSGLLAGIYSAGDRMKRKLGGLLQNPLETIALGSTRMAEDTNALARLASEAGYMPNTVNRADQSVLVSPQQKALARALLAEKATEMGGAMMGGTKFVYPQEQALLTAQRNAAKPVSKGGLALLPNNTPEERAAAMGFISKPGYHGTVEDVPSFDPRRFGSATGAPSASQGVFVAMDPAGAAKGGASTASQYAMIGDRTTNRLNRAMQDAEKRGNWGVYEDATQKLEDYEIGKMGLATKAGEEIDKIRNGLGVLREAYKYEGPSLQELTQFYPHDTALKMYRNSMNEHLANSGQQSSQKYFNTLLDKYRTAFTDRLSAEIPDGANVMPLMVRPGKVAEKDFAGSPYRDETFNDVIQRGFQGGSDTVALRNAFDPGVTSGPFGSKPDMLDVLAVKDPARLRSRFAAFDPMRRNSPDLLAGALPFTAMADEDSRLQILDILKRNGVPIK